MSNTVGIGRVVDGKFTVSYHYRGSPERRQAFFPDPGPSHRYWPNASIVIDGKLYLFLNLVYLDKSRPVSDPLSAPFVILTVLVGAAGGGAGASEAARFKRAADARDAMKASELAKFSKTFRESDTLVQNIVKSCPVK